MKCKNCQSDELRFNVAPYEGVPNRLLVWASCVACGVIHFGEISRTKFIADCCDKAKELIHLIHGTSK